jgi:hypothetical protein
MKFEYAVKTFPIRELEEEGIVTDPRRNIVYACTADAGCEVQDIRVEQAEKLASLFNAMGQDGWELIQMFFHSSGIVSFWKRTMEQVIA